MRRRAKPGVLLVATREWRWIMRDRLAPILIFGVPLIAFIALTAIFSSQVIRGLGVVVVDDDRSQTSSIFIEALAASANLKIVERATDLTSASRAIRSGEVLAAVHIPAGFERDLKAERRPQVVAFYNQQPLTASGIASQGLGDALNAAANGVSVVRKSAPTAPKSGTLAVQNIVLVNPARNYAQYLLRSLLPMVLHVVIAISAGYAVGSEFRRRSLRTWLACAGGSPIVALAGKMTPLFAVFTLMMFALALIIEGLYEIPFKGDVAMMIAAAMLFIVAYLAVGALLQLLTRDLATGLSITSLFVSPRLCRRRLSDPRHEHVCAELERHSAASLVYGRSIRPGGTRAAGSCVGEILRDPGRPSGDLFDAGNAATEGHRREPSRQQRRSRNAPGHEARIARRRRRFGRGMETNPVRPGRVRHGGDGACHLWPLLPATILDRNSAQDSYRRR